MITRNMIINAVFMLVSILIVFVLAKLLLFCAGLGFAVDAQTEAITMGLFLTGGFFCSLYVIYQNRPTT